MRYFVCHHYTRCFCRYMRCILHYEVMIPRGLGKSFWKIEYSVRNNMDCGRRTTDYGLGIKHGEYGIKYGLRYKTRIKVLHWINEHFYKWKLPVIIEVSFKKILNSSFPESVRLYRFNHTRLPKKKLKVTNLWIFEWSKLLLNVLKDHQSRESRRIWTTCAAVYLYDNVNT